MANPKSIKDFKKASTTNANNNPILQQKQNGNYGNGPKYTSPLDEATQGAIQPAQNSSRQQMQQAQQSTSNSFDAFSGQPDFPVATNGSLPLPIGNSQPIQQEEFPKPNFLSDTTDYNEIAKQTMAQVQPQTQPQMQPQIQSQMQPTIEQIQPPVEEIKMQSYNQVPYAQTQVQPKPMGQKSNITTRVAEVEAEIDALVSNTEIFLGNITKLKLDIINARSIDELSSIMEETQKVLSNIPAGFIDKETCRKIRVCFSHLEKTKKNLLDTETGLLNLAAINDVEELEKAYIETPASASADAIYEVRTFEIELLSKLPEIKEEMMRERVLSAYQR